MVVEHDEQMMRSSDHVVDMGPGAGEHGGHVIAEGRAEDIERSRKSITGQFLSGKRTIAVPERRTEDLGSFFIRGASMHNLKGIDVEFPVGKFICVTGVSGSGKSTLVNEIVYKALANRLHRLRVKPGDHIACDGIECFDKVIDIDQSPIGRTPRSNPATYTKLFDHIRELYSQTPDAKVRGYKPGRFSFNVRGGRCETCKGDGTIKIEMHFLPDVYVPCETCKGKRYNRETLEVRFKGKSIADVLEMSIEEALAFFAKIPKIRRRLQTLHDVGLDYVKLGQPATTLSGGEAQRVKLSAELSKVATGKTLYILDEPTTGLHFADIEKLLDVLQRLVDAGNTVLVIEHNLDVIKQADWIVDLGPEGGEAGGELIATGTPEQVAEVDGSFTRSSSCGAALPSSPPPTASLTSPRLRADTLTAWTPSFRASTPPERDLVAPRPGPVSGASRRLRGAPRRLRRAGNRATGARHGTRDPRRDGRDSRHERDGEPARQPGGRPAPGARARLPRRRALRRRGLLDRRRRASTWASRPRVETRRTGARAISWLSRRVRSPSRSWFSGPSRSRSTGAISSARAVATRGQAPGSSLRSRSRSSRGPSSSSSTGSGSSTHGPSSAPSER